MKPLKLTLLIAAVLAPASPIFADDLSDLKAEITQMRADYEQRINQLEQRLAVNESSTTELNDTINNAPPSPIANSSTSKNSFNPAISMVLNGSFNQYQNNPEDYALDGFALQGEGELGKQGFSLGESELTLSANIDQALYGQATLAIHEHEGSTEVEIEEAFIESLGLGNGLTARAGRFFAPIGYLNQRHIHTWNFADAPLIYRGLFGNQLSTDGLKLAYVLPTDQLFEIGATVGAGDSYPGGGDHNGIGDWLIYAKTGGDIGIESSWQASMSHWQSNPEDRQYSGGHSHGAEPDTSALFNGDTDISNVSLVYKWAKNGNFRQQNFSLVGEYFLLNDDGDITHGNEFANYDGKQYGGYVEGVYQFNPQWRSGLRYDWVGSDHKASDNELLADAGLDGKYNNPQRSSVMVEYLPSEFSRIRAQVNYDQSYNDDDLQLLLQYTVSLGAHGAHSY
ncbi:MAG: hypothetical protein MUQ51_01785 [Pseudomonadota bacterium]|nr:hypothetical protein [Pseudomonadota bacterium]MDO7710343.1 hypothetical protein [Pseudomonadota bacterium]